MAFKAEQRTSRSLRILLGDLVVGSKLPESELLSDLLTGLEYFIPEILRELYPSWLHESLDGVIPLTARKTCEREAELFGLCIIISDQTLTPLHVRLQVAELTDEISWIDCNLGEKSGSGMLRLPYRSRTKTLHSLEGREDVIEWSYRVTYGSRIATSTPQ